MPTPRTVTEPLSLLFLKNNLFTYFSIGQPIIILIIYSKDPNLKTLTTLSYHSRSERVCEKHRIPIEAHNSSFYLQGWNPNIH